MPLMDPAEIATYAKGIAAALRVIGPTPRDQALGMLRALDLSDAAAVTVLDHALAHGLLAHTADGHVCAPPQRRRATSTAVVTPRSPRPRSRPRTRAFAGAAPYVLVIEDDDVLRAAMRAALEEEGHAVVAVVDGAGALAVLAGRGCPSVAVAGAVMSMGDGLAFVRRLRAAPACASLPVITASTMPVSHPPVGTTFLSEPLTAATLVRAVGKLVQPPSGRAPRTPT